MYALDLIIYWSRILVPIQAYTCVIPIFTFMFFIQERVDSIEEAFEATNWVSGFSGLSLLEEVLLVVATFVASFLPGSF